MGLFLAGLLFAHNVCGSSTEASTDVHGIITSDTTWTEANSPYSITGPISISQGVTLTIESGVTVHASESNGYIQVNGTLIAKGTTTDPINIWAYVIFTDVSNSWNPQTGSGAILQNAYCDSVTIQGSSPKIDSCSLNDLLIQQGSPTISKNIIINTTVSQGSPYILNNRLISGISVEGGSPLISNNTIGQSYDKKDWYDSNIGININNVAVYVTKGSPVLDNNLIVSQETTGNYYGLGGKIGIALYGTDGIVITDPNNNASIRNNVFVNCAVGIAALGAVTITGNFVNNSLGVGIDIFAGSVLGSPRIMGNFVNGTQQTTGGQTIGIEIASGDPTVENNTLTFNHIGVNLPSASGFSYNNFYNNGINVYLTSSGNLDASNNWWGTTDTSAIIKSIYDFNNDFNLGNVTFTPPLSSPNTQAILDSNQLPSTTTNDPTQPTSLAYSPIPEFQALTVGIIVFVVISLILIASRKKLKY